MLLKIKESAKRRLRIGTRTKDFTPDLPHADNSSEAPTTSITSLIWAPPTSPISRASVSGILPNPQWSSSAASLPTMLLTTGLPPSSKTADDNVRPVLDNRNTIAKVKPRPEAYVWSGLKKLWGLLDSSAETFGPLKSAIGELKWWIDIYENTTKETREYIELRIKLDSLLGDLSKFVSRSASSPIMLPNLVALGGGIRDELELVLQKQRKTSIQRFSEILDGSDEVTGCYRRINAHLERFMFNANLCIWETVDQQATDALIGKLALATSAMYNSAEATDVKRGACAPGTRQKELKKLSEWAHGGEHKIYWLNGMAGTGKTTIVYSLCAELGNSQKLGASFFCSRMIPECRNVKHILPSVAYQLASFSPSFRYALSQILKSDRDVHNRILKDQFESLIIKPLLEAKHTLTFDIVVVIDALDECENDNSVGQILDLLLGSDLSLPIRFLISSRPEPEIYRRMMKRIAGSSDARLVLHELDQSAVQNDIQMYLTHELDGIPLTSAQIEALAERSGILFIYAATAASYIKAGYLLMEHEDRLNMILGLSPPSTEGKDKYIDELYQTILGAAFNNATLDQFSRERMSTILNAVVCAQEPVTTRSLAKLLQLKSGEQVEALLRPLGSVIHVSEKSSLVTVLHTSFPDFLVDQRRSTTFYCDPVNSNASFARACLRTIRYHNPQFNICHIESSYYPDDEIADLKTRMDHAITPELFYSCQYWANHVQLAEKSQELIELVHDFLSVRLLLWMEVLNLKKCIHLGVNIMNRIEEWGLREVLEEIVELAHDAWRFVTMFASHPVSTSTPHIYLSMLPFWPFDGPMTRHYAPRMQNMIKPIGTALARRQPALLATWFFGNQVTSTRFSPDDSRVAVAAGRELFIIDGYTGQRVLGPLTGHTNSISSVEFSPNGVHLATSSWDGTIRVWNAQTGQTSIGPLMGHTLSVESIHFSPDGTRIVSGSWDATLRVWDTITGETVLGPLEGHIAFVTSVSFSPDGQLIASGSSDKTIRIWDAQTGIMKYEPLQGHTAGVTSIAFSPDGSRLASGSLDGGIKIWDVRQAFKCILNETSGAVVTSIQFSPDGQRIISASEDKIIRIHDPESGAVADSLIGHTNDVTSAMFSHDAGRILSSSFDHSVRIWDAKAKHVTTWSAFPDGPRNEINVVRYVDGDTYIASRSIDRVVRTWNPETSQNSRLPIPSNMRMKFSKEQICVAFSGSKVIASGSRFGTIEIHPPSLRVQTLVGRRGGITALAWSPDDKYIASGAGGAIQIWNVQTEEAIFDQLASSSDPVTSVATSFNNQFAAASSGAIITVWQIEKAPNSKNTLQGHTQLVTSIAFSPNSELIASGSKDKTVRIWSHQAESTIFGIFRGHTDEVTSVAFSPNGTQVASASRDMRICLWDIYNKDMLFDVLEGHTGAVLSVTFSQNGAHIASGSSDCTIRVWSLNLEDTNKHSNSPANFTSWTLTLDGWIRDLQGRSLLWVPPDLRTSLLRPRNTTNICSNGFLKLDFESVAIGETWSNITPN